MGKFIKYQLSDYYYYYYVGTKSDLRQITPSTYQIRLVNLLKLLIISDQYLG